MTVTMKAESRSDEQPADYSRPGLTLRRAAGIFASTFNARLLAFAVVAAAVSRVALGGWSWWDLAVTAIILALQPFTEWVIHVTVLHLRPRRLGRWTLDPLLARRHRQHHRKPKVIGLILVPRPALIASLGIGVPLLLLVVPTVRLAMTAMITSYAMYLLYEWTHFLIHSSYAPRGRYYRYIHRAHRLHHFRNERYWYGVTVHLADHILRTFPAKDAVPVSDTAFTLGVDVSSAAPAATASL